MTLQLTPDEEQSVLVQRKRQLRSAQELPIRKAVYAFEYMLRANFKGEGDPSDARDQLASALADLIHGDA